MNPKSRWPLWARAGALGPLAAAAAAGALILAAACALPAQDGGDADEQKPPDPEQVQGAIDGALKWLADSQVAGDANEGYWDCPAYRTATASFAGLAFLANGYRPGEGRYGRVIDRAMRFVQQSMDEEGYLGGKQNSMYVHAVCALFGLSYLGCSDEPQREVELAKWCRRSLELILEAQKVRKAPAERGGWRYTPHARDSDVSVTSWQLLVLHAARQCGYPIDDLVVQNAMRYVKSGFMTDKKGRTGFVYRPGVSQDVEPAVTGVAVFLKALFEETSDENTAKSLAFLREFTPAWGGPQYKGYFFFGTFYMIQGMFQVGGKDWAAFAPRIQRILLDHQSGEGYWDLPEDNAPQSHLAGRAYSTAMGVLILAVDKQYLPMYQRQRRLFAE
jgi:hypothetical protein